MLFLTSGNSTCYWAIPEKKAMPDIGCDYYTQSSALSFEKNIFVRNS